MLIDFCYVIELEVRLLNEVGHVIAVVEVTSDDAEESEMTL